MIMETQLKEEEKSMKEMSKIMQTRGIMENAEGNQISGIHNADEIINDKASAG